MSYASDSTSTTLNQARNISMSDLTITTTGGAAFNLVSCKDSILKTYTIKVLYSLGDALKIHAIGIR